MNLKIVYNSAAFMVVEFIVFYIFFPFLVNAFLDGWYKIIPLVLIAVFFLFLLLLDPKFDRRVLTRFKKDYLGKSVARMLIITVLLVWFTFWIFPELFFLYPVENFKSYAITFFLYPLASVFPQEIIYRVYYFHRYHKIVPEKYLLMLSNAIVFGLTHFIYDNWVAPIATFLAGWIFIHNYYKTRSLLNVSLEHYFYGLIMFTIGFGYFFQ
ncbi:CPBP family glutamic-type intramembrane protease [Salinimicrobium sediminilitoris]|uniref:CPBP family glutamic-type intramembrane protease n=1 Tax=Salinimicrobium sediminilitoris TaxID=2876715 RepID=UPI001E60A80D|nr:CPBP family glutamic-type intramembrane protease [Salinimicrobium sediminilitoris]MCC8358631.1 CPBP family intramembrane metalloprotease [Salinimicrobium sediminilitoris]